jgi:hypothetical protein
LTISRGKAEKQAARAARLSAALRENLKRRKAQARGRQESVSVAESVKASESSSPANPPDKRPTPDFRRNRGRD